MTDYCFDHLGNMLHTNIYVLCLIVYENSFGHPMQIQFVTSSERQAKTLGLKHEIQLDDYYTKP